MTIKPFKINIPQADLDDLRQRIGNTRWAAQLPGEPWSRGTDVDYLKGLAEYWRDGFDWRAQEARLNEFPQFTTEIDGQNIHFLHVKSPEAAAEPLLLVHGWPGSFVEFENIIGPLTNPGAHGGNAGDAFHVVIPSIPGFAFSGPTHEEGWNTARVAAAFATLMKELGYDRYFAQGGDLGAGIVPQIGRDDSDHVMAVHVNAASVGFIPFGPVQPEVEKTLTDVEKKRVAMIERFTTDQFGYNHLQATRPQTLAFALNDSPVGQLAWIVEKFKEWTDPAADLPDDAVDRDHMLTNITIYWLTGTAGSSANMYYEDSHAWNMPTKGATPTGVSNFAQDVAIRHYGEQSNNITFWADHDTGGHFAAMETPDLLVADIRKFFSAYR